jgi:hypothetical protein
VRPQFGEIARAAAAARREAARHLVALRRAKSLPAQRKADAAAGATV